METWVGGRLYGWMDGNEQAGRQTTGRQTTGRQADDKEDKVREGEKERRRHTFFFSLLRETHARKRKEQDTDQSMEGRKEGRRKRTEQDTDRQLAATRSNSQQLAQPLSRPTLVESGKSASHGSHATAQPR
jgi:hypothetical protein